MEWTLISLNINGLNSPIKIHRLTDWIQRQNPTCCIQETHLEFKDRHYLWVKGWDKTLQSNGPKKQAGVAILVSNKLDFKLKSIKRDEEGHFIFITGKNPSGRSLSSKHLCPKYKGINIRKRNIKTQITNKISHSYSGILQHPTLTTGQDHQTET